jgi:glutaredoxin
VGLMLYALSTCGWCKKTKALLDELGLAYDYLFINDLEGEEKEAARAEVMQWNPNCNFPTLVVGGTRCIVGYQEEAIRKLAAHE